MSAVPKYHIRIYEPAEYRCVCARMRPELVFMSPRAFRERLVPVYLVVGGGWWRLAVGGWWGALVPGPPPLLQLPRGALAGPVPRACPVISGALRCSGQEAEEAKLKTEDIKKANFATTSAVFEAYFGLAQVMGAYRRGRGVRFPRCWGQATSPGVRLWGAVWVRDRPIVECWWTGRHVVKGVVGVPHGASAESSSPHGGGGGCRSWDADPPPHFPARTPHPQGCTGRGGGNPPPPLYGAQPMPSHCLPGGKCQRQWRL